MTAEIMFFSFRGNTVNDEADVL